MDAQEGKVFAALLIAACIIATILIFFLVTIVRYHRQHVALYRERIAGEIKILEKERARIAADLHDQLGPMLSTAKFQASVLKPGTEAEQKIICRLKENIDVMISDIRSISNNLRPTVLERWGFYKALESFVNSITDASDIKVRLIHKGSCLPMPAETELHVFRIIQELVNNALKHSGALLVTVEVHQQGGRLQLAVRDNGCGFEMDEVIYNSKGSGIGSVISRVELLKGKLNYQAVTGEGVLYQITIPIFYEQNKDQGCDCR